MIDPSQVEISCGSVDGIVGACNDAVLKLSPTLRMKLNQVFSMYLHRFEIEGVFERLNNRTVAQILAECDSKNSNVVASGERDGTEWTLYDEPETKKGS